MTRHFLSVLDYEPGLIDTLARRAVAIAQGPIGRGPSAQGRNSPSATDRPLAGRTIGLYFAKTSTRTRSAFAVAASRLGATPLIYGPADLQINTGESIEDTARVLAGYLDALVIRSCAPLTELQAWTRQDRLPIINAMGELEHPTQALADLATMIEVFGSLEGLELLYAGEGNNTAVALAFAMSRVRGARFTCLTPEGYGLPPAVAARARALSDAHGARFDESHDATQLPSRVDVLYTTRWQTTGTTKPDPDWRQRFLPFRVDASMLARVSKPVGTIFMHDLPANRGEDVDSDVLDGPQSVAFRQAEYKMFSAAALLEWCIAGGSPEGTYDLWHSRGDRPYAARQA